MSGSAQDGKVLFGDGLGQARDGPIPAKRPQYNVGQGWTAADMGLKWMIN